jgi:hypothetical protein
MKERILSIARHMMEGAAEWTLQGSIHNQLTLENITQVASVLLFPSEKN